MAKYKIGDTFIAKNTFKDCGYVRGDTLIIETAAAFKGDFLAKNLTRPDLPEYGYAYIGDCFRGKRLRNDLEEVISYKVYFLGVPLFTVRKAADE